jgi:hypothetical protein
VDDADLDDAERANVHIPESEEPDDDASWPVLSDLDLAVCLVDDGRTDARSAFFAEPTELTAPDARASEGRGAFSRPRSPRSP